MSWYKRPRHVLFSELFEVVELGDLKSLHIIQKIVAMEVVNWYDAWKIKQTNNTKNVKMPIVKI